MTEQEEKITHHDRFYRSNEQLKAYYQTLPGEIQIKLCQAAGPITTLGELQAAAEHLQTIGSPKETGPQ